MKAPSVSSIGSTLRQGSLAIVLAFGIALSLASAALDAPPTAVAASAGGAIGPAPRATPIPDSSQRPVPLTPGRLYLTGRFRPQLTLKLPPGSWQTTEAVPESPTVLSIQLKSASADFAIVTLVRPSGVFDPVLGGGGAADGKPVPADFIGWLRHHPRLHAGTPVASSVGRIPARQVDVTVVSAPKHRPAECGTHPCLPLYLDGSAAVEFGPGDRIRYLSFKVKGKPVLAELYVSPARSFAMLAPKLQAALASYRFKS